MASKWASKYEINPSHCNTLTSIFFFFSRAEGEMHADRDAGGGAHHGHHQGGVHRRAEGLPRPRLQAAHRSHGKAGRAGAGSAGRLPMRRHQGRQQANGTMARSVYSGQSA